MARALTATKWYATIRMIDITPRLLAMRARVRSEIIVVLGLFNRALRSRECQGSSGSLAHKVRSRPLVFWASRDYDVEQLYSLSYFVSFTSSQP